MNEVNAPLGNGAAGASHLPSEVMLGGLSIEAEVGTK